MLKAISPGHVISHNKDNAALCQLSVEDSLFLALRIGLQILVGSEGNETTDKDNSVKANTQAGCI